MWLRIEGNSDIKTIFITVYLPCKPKKQVIFLHMHNNNKNWDINSYHGCTKDKFRTDLLAFIKLHKNKGDKIILMLDGNENIQL